MYISLHNRAHINNANSKQNNKQIGKKPVTRINQKCFKIIMSRRSAYMCQIKSKVGGKLCRKTRCVVAGKQHTDSCFLICLYLLLKETGVVEDLKK